MQMRYPSCESNGLFDFVLTVKYAQADATSAVQAMDAAVRGLAIGDKARVEVRERMWASWCLQLYVHYTMQQPA